MTSRQSSAQNHSLIVAVKKHLAKVIAPHSINHELKHRMSPAQNVTYSQVINLIQTPTSIEEIYRSVLTETYSECQPCENDILSLIQLLAQSGLVDVQLEIKAA
ncbi:MAG: PqqD family protein [Cyanobacteria bacterium J06627_8]